MLEPILFDLSLPLRLLATIQNSAPTVIRVDVVQHDAIPIVNIIVGLIAAVAAGISYWNARSNRSKLQVDSLMNLGRESQTQTFEDAVKKILTLNFLNAVEFNRALHGMTEAESSSLSSQILLVTQLFDKAGYLVRKRHIDFDLIRAAYRSIIIEVWEHTKTVLLESKQTHELVFPNNFVWLASKMAQTIKPYSAMQKAEIARKLKHIADGTGTEEDRTFS